MDKYVDEFLDYIKFERKYSEHTLKSYKKDLEQFFKFLKLKGIEFLKDITRQSIKDFLMYLYSKNYSKKSMFRKLSTLKSFFKFLNRFGFSNEDPTEFVSYPKLEEHFVEIIDEEDIEKIIEYIKERKDWLGKRDLAIFEVLFATGMRNSELINLKWNDLSLETKNIFIRQAKGNKDRVVLLTDFAVKALKEYREVLKSKGKLKEWVFLNKNFNKLTDRGLRDIFKRYEKILGKKLWPHKMRHSMATVLIKYGMSLRGVQELLGHSSINTTAIYLDVTPDKLHKEYDKYFPLKDD